MSVRVTSEDPMTDTPDGIVQDATRPSGDDGDMFDQRHGDHDVYGEGPYGPSGDEALDPDYWLRRALSSEEWIVRHECAALRAAAQTLLDAHAEPVYSWVIESQEARAEGRPNREVERMDRVNKAWQGLRAALGTTSSAPDVLRAAEMAEEFISKLEQTLSDMAPLYHETAIAAESDYDDLHPGVSWDRCPDPLCARARALTGQEPGYPPREDRS